MVIYKKNQGPSFISGGNNSFYNSPCPSLQLVDLADKKISLEDLRGQVILLYFSKFYAQDVPTMIFLKHLWERFNKNGLNLFVIYPSQIINLDHIFRYYRWEFPVIKGEERLISGFQARLNDVVIVGRDFKIKFKLNSPPPGIIYRQIRRHLDSDYRQRLSLFELERRLKELSFYDIIKKESKKLVEEVRGRPIIINLFLSPCFSCPVNQRMAMIKQVCQEMTAKGMAIFNLFAQGNDPGLIEEYALKNDLFGEYSYVGTINRNQHLADDAYLDLFDFEIDPRLFLLNSQGELVFSENRDNQRDIKIKFI